MSIPQATVENTLLAASLKIATLVNSNLTQLSGGNLSVSWKAIKRGNRGYNAVQRQYNLGDYSSANFLKAYSCLENFVGTFGAGTINPNAQNPGTIINVTTVTQAIGNATRIPFSGVLTTSLSNFQSTYALIYGSDAVVSVWVTTDNYATATQDEGTPPTIVNLGGDINKPDSYTWTWGIPTTGYIQINGSTPQGGNTSAGLPITNNSAVLLTDAQLNALFPNGSFWGQLVLLPNANARYEKLDNSPTGAWDYQPYNPNV